MQGDSLRSSVVGLYPANFLINSDVESVSGVFRFFEFLQFNILRYILRLMNSSVHKVLTAVFVYRIDISEFVLPRLIYHKF
jgi:hypothetical protein